MPKAKYRFTEAKAKFLREMLQRLGQVVPDLSILKVNGTLLYFGKDEEGYEIGLAPCLQVPYIEEGISAKTFHRATLSKLIEYDPIFEGRELVYLVDLLQTINFLIRHTAAEDPSRIGAQLSKQGVTEFDAYPENPLDDGFEEWFERGAPRRSVQTQSASNDDKRSREHDVMDYQDEAEASQTIDVNPPPSNVDSQIIPMMPMSFPTPPVLDKLGEYGWLRLYEDLLEVFDTADDFNKMLRLYVLDHPESPESVAALNRDHDVRVLEAVTKFNREGRIVALVSGAVQAKRQSPSMQHWRNWLTQLGDGMA